MKNNHFCRYIFSVSCLILFGCDQQTSVKESIPIKPDVIATKTSLASEPKKSLVSEPVAYEIVKKSQSEPEKEKNSSVDNIEDLGFALMESETLGQLKLGLSKNQVEEMLGTPDELSEKTFWEADGEYHQTYFYKKLGVTLTMVGDNQVINMIEIKNPCDFKTSKNIFIGSSYKEVMSAYKKYYSEEFSSPDTFVAGSIYGGVMFNFARGKVESIIIGAVAE
jgi:hypothetical protein